MHPIHIILTGERHVAVFCSCILLFLFIKRGDIAVIRKWGKIWDGQNKKVEYILRILIFPVGEISLFVSSVLVRNKYSFSPQFFRNIHPVRTVESMLRLAFCNMLKIGGSAHLRIFFFASSFSTVFTLKRISSFFGKNTSSIYTAMISSFYWLKEYAEGELFLLSNFGFQDRYAPLEMRNITAQDLYVFSPQEKTICGICSVTKEGGTTGREHWAGISKKT